MRHPAEYAHGPNIYPAFPPDGWAILQEWGDGYALRHRSGVRVIIDVRFVNDAPWLHVSYSRSSRLPSWEDTRLVKEDFIGDNVAISVLPKGNDYVNIHQFCFHLWHSVAGETCPNFTAEVAGVKSI